MSRLAQRFSELKIRRRVALVPYVMAGDPEPWITVPLMHALVTAGANAIELGVPFSDPMADGPVIQHAAERALRHGIGVRRVLDMVREFRKKDFTTPIILMGYLNPIEALGYQTFAAQTADAGADGVLTVDLPPEEAGTALSLFADHGLDAIFLLAPTSGPNRIRAIVESARGFVYYVALRGVTGASHLDVHEVSEKIRVIRRYTELPLGVGFGISGPQAAAEVARFADAVVVGSAVVRLIECNADDPQNLLAELPKFIASLRSAMDSAGEMHAQERTELVR